jgi:hypothetical protein
MRTPTTVKGYLKMLIKIANDTSLDLKNVTDEEIEVIGGIRADIQNNLSDEKAAAPLLRKYNLEYNG